MVMGTTLDTVNLSNLYSWFVSAFCSLAGGRQTRRPIDLGGVLYRESFFAGEGIILEGEQDQSPYDTGHRAISPCLRFCLKTGECAGLPARSPWRKIRWKPRVRAPR